MNDEKIQKIATDILQLSRSTLLVNFRFLDMAISQLRWKPYNKGAIRTNGETAFYNPGSVLINFKNCKEKPTRDYMHVLLHCIYRHMFVSSAIDRLVWDLACDIAVENIISEFELDSLKTPVTEKQKPIIDLLAKDCEILTAEKIYTSFKRGDFTVQELQEYANAFRVDEHDIWYQSEENKEKNTQNENGGAEENGKSNTEFGSSTRLSIKELREVWEKISERMQSDIMHFSNGRYGEAGSIVQNLKEVNRERYDYRDFLKRFAVLGEKTKINDDEFDYVFYTYGLQLYDNMPLVEPLEYKDVKSIKEFVIAIDTSGSVIGDLVQEFIQKTCNILKSEESFFTKINLHIIQCDTEIQSDVKITNQTEFDDYLSHMELKGFGGNNEIRLFEYVDQLIADKEFSNLKGMIYLTDGYGIFPERKPNYEVAFVFINDRYEVPDVPPWVIKLVLDKSDILNGGIKTSEY